MPSVSPISTEFCGIPWMRAWEAIRVDVHQHLEPDRHLSFREELEG
jgi:hypothetical protein